MTYRLYVVMFLITYMLYGCPYWVNLDSIATTFWHQSHPKPIGYLFGGASLNPDNGKVAFFFRYIGAW